MRDFYDFRGFQVISRDFKGFQVIFNDFKGFQGISKGFLDILEDFCRVKNSKKTVDH